MLVKTGCYDPPMHTLTRPQRPSTQSFLPRRLAYLMALHAENHQRLANLFAPQQLAVGRYVSRLEYGLDISLDVLELHPYTQDLRLGYCFVDRDSGEKPPSALLRLYHDAGMAEVLDCHANPRMVPRLGPLLLPARTEQQRRMRMSTFLGRWLEYLAEQGHGQHSLVPAPAADGCLVG